jgi:hypothetical protein
MSIIPVGEELSSNPLVRRLTVNLLRLLPEEDSEQYRALYKPFPLIRSYRASGVPPKPTFHKKDLDNLIAQALEYYWPVEKEAPAPVPPKPCVYVIKASEVLYKVGATKNLKMRLRSHRGLRFNNFSPLHVIYTDHPFVLERHLHAQLRLWQVGKRELFRLPLEARKWLRSINKFEVDESLPIAPWFES